MLLLDAHLKAHIISFYGTDETKFSKKLNFRETADSSEIADRGTHSGPRVSARSKTALPAARRAQRVHSACVIGYEEKTANGKIQKEQEQTEAQPDGA